MTRKSINTTLDTELYSKIKILALKVSAEKQTKVNANDLIEEGIKLIIERYKSKKTSHSIYNINYNIVFCPKYRHSIFKDELETELLKIF